MKKNQLKVNRSFASLSLLIAFIGLLITALIMFFGDYLQKVSVLHICFSLQFIVSLILHLTNNVPSLIKYWKKIKILSISLLFSCGLAFGALFQFLPFNSIYDFEQSKKLDDYQIKSEQLLRYDLLRFKNGYENIQLTKDPKTQVLNLNLDVKKTLFNYSMVFWLESDDGELIEVLGYIVNGSKQQLGQYKILLPHFGLSYPDTILDEPISFKKRKSVVLVMSSDQLEKSLFKMEINFMNDKNESYPVNFKGTLKQKDGQPSIVYQAKLKEGVQWLSLLGKTNESGQIINNTDDLTTVIDKFNSLLVEVMFE